MSNSWVIVPSFATWNETSPADASCETAIENSFRVTSILVPPDPTDDALGDGDSALGEADAAPEHDAIRRTAKAATANRTTGARPGIQSSIRLRAVDARSC
jgi:hypothetical protein